MGEEFVAGFSSYEPWMAGCEVLCAKRVGQVVAYKGSTAILVVYGYPIWGESWEHINHLTFRKGDVPQGDADISEKVSSEVFVLSSRVEEVVTKIEYKGRVYVLQED